MGGWVMSRKDYEALASALGRAWSMAERLGSDDAVLAAGYAVDEVALVLAAGNPRFSLARFEAAVDEARVVESARFAAWLADRDARLAG